MKRLFLSRMNYILILFLLSTSSILAQESKGKINQTVYRDSLLRIAKTIVDSSSCKVFITVDENGKPHAREMSVFPIEENWVIWLGTSQGSRKTKQIQNNPNVIVYYYEPKGMSYVSIAGKARLVNDPDKKAKYWVEGWKRYFPDRDKNYILIEVTPENLEIVSYKDKIFWDSKGAPQSINFISK
jgi:general stress protein 26